MPCGSKSRLSITCCALLGLTVQVAVALADPLAIIASVNGEVLVHPAAGKSAQRAAFGRPLERGDKVEVGDAGSATVVFNDGNLIELSPGSAITVGGRMTEKPDVGPGSSLPDEVFAQVSKYVTGGSRQKGLVALSAMRSGSPDENIALIISPRMSDVLTDRPALRWRAPEGATRYKVTLSGDEGDLWSRETDALELSYPESADPLSPDADYVWRVEAFSDKGGVRDEESFFHVVSAERRGVLTRHLENIERSAGEQSAATCFLSGSYLFSNGLYGDAAHQFEALSRLSPDAPAAHEALGNVYKAVGLMDLAAAEFERALTLTREH